jgi:glucose/arabinose dehydrogenase
MLAGRSMIPIFIRKLDCQSLGIRVHSDLRHFFLVYSSQFIILEMVTLIMKTKIILILLPISLLSISCKDIGKSFMKLYSRSYETEQKILNTKPLFVAEDKDRSKILISLNEVTQIKEPTDIQFPPHDARYMYLLEKRGKVIVFDRISQKSRTILELDVIYDSEEGLLGLTFHPDYPNTPLVYVNYVLERKGKDLTTISEFTVELPESFDSMKFGKERKLIEVEQPYPNHNAGQVAFGKDGYLYIGLGDGGWRGDPLNNGQNPKTLLGSMLRIDPNPDKTLNKPYTIPKDNPFYDSKDGLPEIYAYGLRNPWRFSFAPDGRLIVADVGQDKFEEIDILESGKNYGWNPKEGFHCYIENCKSDLYSDPIYEYGRSEGQSITGGYVYTGSSFSAIQNKYIFGDFISGRIWAIDLPEGQKTISSKDVSALGKWNILISTFGRDSDGEIFLADYQTGKIFKLIEQVSE